MKAHNHSWAAVSMLGQFISAVICAFEAADGRSILFVPTTILIATSIMTFLGWEKLESRSDFEVGKTK